jgi:S-(hydroxymethyl)glutathione dehydrogenase/alcohol dehydrogenase
VLYGANQPFAIEEVSLRDPGPREVVLRTAATGLCHSDLHIVDGTLPHPFPAVLGHESSGVVEAVGSAVTYVQPGDRVVTCPSVFCGACANCLAGRTQICTDQTVKPPPGVADRYRWDRPEKLNPMANLGGFAEQMLVHENAVVTVPDAMPLDRAALLGCGVLTGFGAAVHGAGVHVGDTVVVIGCGGVGLAAVLGCAAAGAGRVIAVDTNPAKLELARTLGASDFVNASEADPVAAVLDLTGGGVHHAIECIGLKQTAEQAIAMLALGGTATIVGLVGGGQTIEIAGGWLLRERRVQGSLMGSASFRTAIPQLVDLCLAGALPLDLWLSRTIALAEIDEGFAAMQSGAVVRSVVDFALS